MASDEEMSTLRQIYRPTISNQRIFRTRIWHSPAELSFPRPSSSLEKMTVRETKEWIYKFGFYKAWDAADEYADSFRENKIDGCKIVKLSNEDLRNQLMITKLGHRLAILSAVRLLLDSDREQESVMERYHRYCQNDSTFSGEESSNGEITKSDPEQWNQRENLIKLRNNVAARNGTHSEGSGGDRPRKDI